MSLLCQTLTRPAHEKIELPELQLPAEPLATAKHPIGGHVASWSSTGPGLIDGFNGLAGGPVPNLKPAIIWSLGRPRLRYSFIDRDMVSRGYYFLGAEQHVSLTPVWPANASTLTNANVTIHTLVKVGTSTPNM